MIRRGPGQEQTRRDANGEAADRKDSNIGQALEVVLGLRERFASSVRRSRHSTKHHSAALAERRRVRVTRGVPRIVFSPLIWHLLPAWVPQRMHHRVAFCAMRLLRALGA